MSTAAQSKELFRLRDGLWHQGTFADDEAKLQEEAERGPRDLGLRLFAEKKFPPAAPILEYAVSLSPDDYTLRFTLGRALALAAAGPPQSRTLRGRGSRPSSRDARYYYGDVLLKVGKFTAAEEQFCAALQLRP